MRTGLRVRVAKLAAVRVVVVLVVVVVAVVVVVVVVVCVCVCACACGGGGGGGGVCVCVCRAGAGAGVESKRITTYEQPSCYSGRSPSGDCFFSHSVEKIGTLPSKSSKLLKKIGTFGWEYNSRFGCDRCTL